MKPLAIDLFCGLGGWAEGLLMEGYDVIGFDIEHHVYGDEKYPAQLVLQDVLTLHGKQFKTAALIVASPPCQAYSYRAMPWKRAKALPPPDNSLFDACFRIQREACEAAGHHIPMVIENVRGACKWVGRSRWNFGSFHLWGDVPALMPMAKAIKNNGSSWFNIGSPGQKELNRNPVHADTKVGGITVGGYGTPGYKAVAFNGTALARLNETGVKGKDDDGYERNHPNAFGWKVPRTSSKGLKRKCASAMIAKIPLPLSRYIARTFYPRG